MEDGALAVVTLIKEPKNVLICADVNEQMKESPSIVNDQRAFVCCS